MPSRCGRIVNDHFITNFLLNLQWRNFEHRLIWQKLGPENGRIFTQWNSKIDWYFIKLWKLLITLRTTRVAVTRNSNVLFRLRWTVVTYERHTNQLRVSVGDIGRQVLRTCRSALRGPRCQCSGKRRHHGWADVVQSEWEVTVSAQSQVSWTVSTVPRCTGQLWTAACPQRHLWQTRLSLPVTTISIISLEWITTGNMFCGTRCLLHYCSTFCL